MTGYKRRIFYVGGFDPRGMRFYYNLLKEQVARWGTMTGQEVAVVGRRKASPIRTDCTVTNTTAGVVTDYSFLRWEDIVRRAWIKSPVDLARRAVRTYDRHRRFIDWKLAFSLPSGPLKTLAYPPLVTLLLPLILALPIALLGLLVVPWWAAGIVALAIGVAGAIPILRRIQTPWLLRFFVFNSEFGEDRDQADIHARLDAFADDIIGGLYDGHDEVLLVTHSNGGILAVELMARLIARVGTLPANFALVTLGQCIPLVAGRRDAVGFRARLAQVARGDFHWVDIGSPPDGAAYHGVETTRIVDPAPVTRTDLLSPRFHLFYDPQNYHSGWRNKYEIHFDYLRVGDHLSPLDYPAIVAGPRPIAQSIAAFRQIP